MAFINPVTDIALAAMALTVISQIIQRKLVDREKMKKQQQKMRDHQKRMKELTQKQDKQSKQEMERIEKEFMETANETMRGSLKQLAVSTPIILIAFWYLGETYRDDVIQLPVQLPWFGSNGIQLFSETTWIGWYVVNAIIFAVALNIIISFIEKAKK